MLTTKDTALVLIDVQEKLLRAMHDKEVLVDNVQKIVKGARLFGLPIVWTEQNPAGLGATVPQIAELLPDKKPLSKFSFSCCANDQFQKELEAIHRKNILIIGIETHVCIYQTAADLTDRHYHVEVVSDAVSSRTPANKHIGLEKCKDAGACLTSTETALFELLKEAKGEQFKAIMNLVK